MFEGLHCKVEPDLDVINTQAALDRLLENVVVRNIPRDESAVMKHLTTKWVGRNATTSGSTKFASWDAKTDDTSYGKTSALGASYCTGQIVDNLSLKRRDPFTLDCTDAFHQDPELEDVGGGTIRREFESNASGWQMHKHLVEDAKAIAGSTPNWSGMG